MMVGYKLKYMVLALKKMVAKLIDKITLFIHSILSVFCNEKFLLKWKPIHLCWWFKKYGCKIPKYFIGAAGDITYGSEYTFNEGTVDFSSSNWLDSTHVVVAFEDSGDSSNGKAIIGTLSAGTITYGSEYQFDTSIDNEISVKKIDATHFVVAYYDGNNGMAVIGTVASGNEISYGTLYQFNAGSTKYTRVGVLDSTHIIITYSDNANSDYGAATIGVITSTDTITFGSEYNFNEAASDYNSLAVLDSTHFVVAYRDISTHGEAVVGVVSSGDEIAYGTLYEYNAANLYYLDADAISSTSFVLVYRDVGNSNKGTSIIGIVSSGDEITFGDKDIYLAANHSADGIVVLDSTTVVVSYYNYSSVYTVSGTIANDDELSYGTASELYAGEYDRISMSKQDATNFLVIYRDHSAGGDNYGESVIGTSAAPEPAANTGAFFQLF